MTGNMKGHGKGGKRSFDTMNNNNGNSGDDNKKQQANAKREELESAYNEVANELAPVVAGCIDSYGGVCLLSQVSNDARVMELIQRVPNGFSSKLSKIIEKYPDFIVPLEGGYVATAMGYENGIVQPNGTLNKDQVNKKKINGEEDAPRGKAPPAKKQKLNTPTVSNNTGVYQQAFRSDAAAKELESVANELYDASLQSDENALQNVIERLNEARKKAFYLDANGFRDFCQKVMLDMGCTADDPLHLNKLMVNPDIRSLHNGLPIKERKKIIKLLEDAPEKFTVSRGDGTGNNTVATVALTAQAVKTAEPSTRRPAFNKGKGKGRW